MDTDTRVREASSLPASDSTRRMHRPHHMRRAELRVSTHAACNETTMCSMHSLRVRLRPGTPGLFPGSSGLGAGCSYGTTPAPTHVQSSSLTPLMLCICQRVVALSVATCCPFSRASSSSEKAPWRKWALRRRVGGGGHWTDQCDLQKSFSLGSPTVVET